MAAVVGPPVAPKATIKSLTAARASPEIQIRRSCHEDYNSRHRNQWPLPSEKKVQRKPSQENDWDQGYPRKATDSCAVSDIYPMGIIGNRPANHVFPCRLESRHGGQNHDEAKRCGEGTEVAAGGEAVAADRAEHPRVLWSGRNR